MIYEICFNDNKDQSMKNEVVTNTWHCSRINFVRKMDFNKFRPQNGLARNY